MGKKLYELNSKIIGIKFGRMFTSLSTIWFAILIIFYTMNGEWKNVTYYPEKEYQVLEQEAKRLIQEGDSIEKWKTEYHYIIRYYDNKTKEIEFELCDTDYKLYNPNNASNKYQWRSFIRITAKGKVDDSSNEKIETVRSQKSAVKNMMGEIFILIWMPIMLALMIQLVIYMLASIYIWIYPRMSKRTEQK